jgi:hypothetical protein
MLFSLNINNMLHLKFVLWYVMCLNNNLKLKNPPLKWGIIHNCARTISFQWSLIHEVEEVFITTFQIYDSFSQGKGELALWKFCVTIKRSTLQIFKCFCAKKISSQLFLFNEVEEVFITTFQIYDSFS